MLRHRGKKYNPSFWSGLACCRVKSSVLVLHQNGSRGVTELSAEHLHCLGQTQRHSVEFIRLVSASALLKQAGVPAWGERNRQQFWKDIKRAGAAAPRTFLK